ncbi:hypothetical protein AALA13_18670, partial [Lachnospiraceae bacterium 50-23]
EYSAVDEAISKLQDKLPGASEEEKVLIQAEISNLMDLQNDLLKAFSESEYTIGLDQDSTAEEWNAAFQSFMNDSKKETGIYRKYTSSDRYLSLFTRDSLPIRAPKGECY